MRANRFLLAAALMASFGASSAKESSRVLSKNPLGKPSKQGQKKFTYLDGFECEALNQKNADRKHENCIKNKC